MKKLLLILVVFCCTMAVKAQPLPQAPWDFWYTTTDGNELSSIPAGYNFGNELSVVSHSYTNGQGIITLSGDVTMIGNWAFDSEETLLSVTLPSNVKTIGNYAFCDCPNLTSINFPEGLTSIGVCAFSSCWSLESAILPSTVSRIEGLTFNLCTSLGSVVLPSSITYIGESAFDQCGNLKTITCDATTPPTIGTDAFRGVNNVTSVTVPSIALYQENAGWQKFNGKFVDKFQSARDVQKSNIANAFNQHSSPMGETIKANALHDIEYATSYGDICYIGDLCCAKIISLNGIYAFTSIYDSDYLDGIVQPYIDGIVAVNDPSFENAYLIIVDLEHNAIEAFQASAAIYDTIRDEVLGELPTEGNSGPAVRIIKEGKSDLILYNPDKVEFLKVEE